jgi:hypothetical protein
MQIYEDQSEQRIRQLEQKGAGLSSLGIYYSISAWVKNYGVVLDL